MVLAQQIAVQQEQAAPLVNLSGVFGAAVAIAVCAWLLRGRLPAGMCEGMFAAGLSGALALAFVAGAEPSNAMTVLAHVAAALALAWAAASRAPGLPRPPRGRHRDARREAYAWWALVCGSVVAAIVVANDGDARERIALTVDVLVLGLAATVARIGQPSGNGAEPVLAGRCDRPGGWFWYAAIGLGGLLVSLWLPVEPIQTQRYRIAMAAIAVSGGGMLAFIGTLGSHWWRQRRQWLAGADFLSIAPLAAPGAVALTATAALSAFGAALGFATLTTPVALVLASLTCLGIGHCRSAVAVSEFGLAILVAAFASVGSIAGGPYGLLAGLSVGAGFLLWLARFWDQQLYDGRAWTTAGRMIPVARRLIRVIAAVTIVSAAALVMDPQPGRTWSASVAVALLALLAVRIARDAGYCRDRRSVFAACLFMTSAALVFARIGPDGGSAAHALPAAAGAFALVTPFLSGLRSSALALGYVIFAGGYLPAAIVLSAFVQGAYGTPAPSSLAVVIAIGGAIVSAVWCWRLAPAQHVG